MWNRSRDLPKIVSEPDGLCKIRGGTSGLKDRTAYEVSEVVWYSSPNRFTAAPVLDNVTEEASANLTDSPVADSFSQTVCFYPTSLFVSILCNRWPICYEFKTKSRFLVER